MKVLAIDQSTKASGICLFEDNKLVKYAVLTETSTQPLKRIINIVDRIEKIYDEYQPDVVVVEDVLPEETHNIKTLHTLLYLLGAIKLMIYRKGKEVEVMVASHWRKICGIKVGRGVKREELKAQSMAFVKEKFGLDVIDDIADSICIGYAFLNQNAIVDTVTDFEII